MAALASWNDNVGKKRLVAIKDPAARDLASKLLIADPLERANFDINAELTGHPFFNPKPGDAATQEKLDKIIEQQEKDSKKLDAILSLSEEHRDELRQTRSTLIRAMFEATEVSTPTAFVVLKEKLPTGEARVELTLNDDGTGLSVEGEAVGEAKDRYEQGKTWLGLCARFGRGVAACSPSAIAEAVAGACEELVVGEEMWLYLVDELTGEPVVPDEDDATYPIRITKPAEVVSKLLPVMQVGLHAASLVNGVAGVVRLFGYPCPKVPEAWREGAQNSVEVLKQESSVEAFGAVHEKVQDDGEEAETVRGAALRELEAFYANYDPDREYAGLRRIGDEDGTAVWTLLTDPEEVKAAIEKRAAQRRAEARRRDERFQELMDNADAGSASETGAAAAATATPIAAAGGGPSAARALASPRRETADSLRRVEDRLASIEDRLQGLGNWFY
jgi:DNA-binding transcriptional MerR regulator